MRWGDGEDPTMKQYFRGGSSVVDLGTRMRKRREGGPPLSCLIRSRREDCHH